MNISDGVVWFEGLALGPELMQWHDRWIARLTNEVLRCCGTYSWGFFELRLDESALTQGRIGIARATGILQDGTPFSIDSSNGPHPLEVSSDAQGDTICLALPAAREGVTEFDFGQGSDRWHRYTVVDRRLHDRTQAENEPQLVQTAKLQFRLLQSSDVASPGHLALSVAKVAERRLDGQVTLEQGFIPPLLRIDAIGNLPDAARLLHGLILRHREQLAQNARTMAHGAAALTSFLKLRSLNAAEPSFKHYANCPSDHPKSFFMDCAKLAAELSTYFEASHVSVDLPLYQHGDLRSCFTPVIDTLRQYLSAPDAPDAIELDWVARGNDILVANLPNAGIGSGTRFVLAAKAEINTREFQKTFPALATVGPPDYIASQMGLGLYVYALELRLLPAVPEQIPFHAGFHYYEIDRSAELWQQVEQQRGIAIHVVPKNFPKLELELWAIRQANA